jgi:hypothetical protein
MADHSICLDPQCKAWADGKVDACPRCGGPMRSQKGPTARGWLLVVCGVLLVGMMGAIMIAVGPSMMNAGKTIDGSTYNGTPEQARIFLGLFALIGVFGLTALINGIFIIVTGRQSRAFKIIGLLLAATLMVVTLGIIYTMK